MNLPMGVSARVSLTVWAFLKVKIPVKLTSEFKAKIRRIAAASFAKQ